jgi:hypothetical protein
MGLRVQTEYVPAPKERATPGRRPLASGLPKITGQLFESHP